MSSRHDLLHDVAVDASTPGLRVYSRRTACNQGSARIACGRPFLQSRSRMAGYAKTPGWGTEMRFALRCLALPPPPAIWAMQGNAWQRNAMQGNPWQRKATQCHYPGPCAAANRIMTPTLAPHSPPERLSGGEGLANLGIDSQLNVRSNRGPAGSADVRAAHPPAAQGAQPDPAGTGPSAWRPSSRPMTGAAST